MDWTRLSEKANVCVFVIVAATSGISLFYWLMAFPTASVNTAANASVVATYPKLPMVLILVLVLSFVFAGITHLMARRSKSRSQPSSDQARNPADQFLKVEDFYRTYDNALLRESEQAIGGEAAKYSPGEDRERFLLRTNATLFWIGVFEITHAVIFGSQLKALHDLNTRAEGMTVDELRPYFEQGLQTVPSEYRDRTFDAWLAYIRDGVLIRQTADRVWITVRGQEFLKYLIARQYPLDRLG
jgi:hypothetical protein